MRVLIIVLWGCLIGLAGAQAEPEAEGQAPAPRIVPLPAPQAAKVELGWQRLVIKWAGAENPNRITRSREDAAAITTWLLATGANTLEFAQLAHERSEDPPAALGVVAGVIAAGESSPYVSLLEALDLGQTCPHGIESPEGFIILRRIPALDAAPAHDPKSWVMPPTEAADPRRVPGPPRVPEAGDVALARRIIVACKPGSPLVRPVPRDPNAARLRATALVHLARMKSSDFRDLVRTYSDEWHAHLHHGSMGLVHASTSPAPLVERVLSLAEGNIGGPYETEHGFEVIERLPADVIALRAIQIRFARNVRAGGGMGGGAGGGSQAPESDGSHAAPGGDESLARNRRKAKEILTPAWEELQAGKPFTDVALRFDEVDPTSGGAIGLVYRDAPFFRRFPALWDAAAALELGALSEVQMTEGRLMFLWRAPILRARVLELPTSGDDSAPREAQSARAENVAKAIAQGASPSAAFAAAASEGHARVVADTGYLGPGDLPLEIERALSSLTPGQASAVLETPSGFKILERLPVREPRTLATP